MGFPLDQLFWDIGIFCIKFAVIVCLLLWICHLIASYLSERG